MRKPVQKLSPVILELPEQADWVLRSPAFEVPNVAAHIDALSVATGEDFSALKALVKSSLIYQDRQSHLAARRMLAPFFREKSIAAWTETIEREIENALQLLDATPEPDLVRDFIDPLYARIITQLVGLKPGADAQIPTLVAHARKFSEQLLSIRDMRAINETFMKLKDLISVDESSEHRPASLAQTLYDEETAIPEGISVDIMIGILVAAGHTMAQSLAYALWGLLTRDRDIWQAATGPGWADRYLNDVLDFYPSTRALYRLAAKDTNVEGCPVHAGQTVLLDIPAINHYIHRSREKAETGAGCRVKTMSFGAGPHKCPGESFARLFTSRVIPALAHRFPNISLDEGQCRFERTPMVQMPRSLPCRLGAD